MAQSMWKWRRCTTPSWRHSHSLVTGGTITIKLPDHSEMPAHSALQKRGIHVYADVEISVYAMNDDVSMSAADAAAVLPVTALSNNYVIPSPQSNPVILVVGLLPDTQVTINLGPTDYPPVSTISPTTNGNTTTVPCADSPGVDCQVLDLTIGICSSGASGQQLCRKHCGLCKTCTSTGSCIVG